MKLLCDIFNWLLCYRDIIFYRVLLFICEKKRKNVFRRMLWHSTKHGLDWTGQLDWTVGLDSWTGQLDWTIGLDSWTGLLDWISNGIFSIK